MWLGLARMTQPPLFHNPLTGWDHMWLPSAEVSTNPQPTECSGGRKRPKATECSVVTRPETTMWLKLTNQKRLFTSLLRWYKAKTPLCFSLSPPCNTERKLHATSAATRYHTINVFLGNSQRWAKWISIEIVYQNVYQCVLRNDNNQILCCICFPTGLKPNSLIH